MATVLKYLRWATIFICIGVGIYGLVQDNSWLGVRGFIFAGITFFYCVIRGDFQKDDDLAL